MKINLVTRDNGVGLSTDMELLEGILRPAGHETERVHWRDKRMAACDVAIFLELFNPALARYARRGYVGIYNLEWFEPRWRGWLPRHRQLWAKSREAYDILRKWNLRNIHHTGFAGRDMLQEATERRLAVFHLAGHSTLKNTDAVIEAWRRNPDLPELILVSHNYKIGDERLPNVTSIYGSPPDWEIADWMNQCAIQLCPSATEGWGHYLAEGVSTGNLVITTDASPMNEHVTPETGILIRPRLRGRHHYAALHQHHPDDIAAAVRRAVAMTPRQRAETGQRGRERMLNRNEAFRAKALDLIGRM